MHSDFRARKTRPKGLGGMGSEVASLITECQALWLSIFGEQPKAAQRGELEGTVFGQKGQSLCVSGENLFRVP